MPSRGTPVTGSATGTALKLQLSSTTIVISPSMKLWTGAWPSRMRIPLSTSCPSGKLSYFVPYDVRQLLEDVALRLHADGVNARIGSAAVGVAAHRLHGVHPRSVHGHRARGAHRRIRPVPQNVHTDELRSAQTLRELLRHQPHGPAGPDGHRVARADLGPLQPAVGYLKEAVALLDERTESA
jgi:hypothetical protein